jgi:YidC/Oxa1 family membrane protein insertase
MAESSKTTTIGVALIMLVFLGWFFLNQPKPNPASNTAVDSTHQAAVSNTDSASALAHARDTVHPGSPAATAAATSTVFTAKADSTPAIEKHIETPLYSATISSKGASLSSFVLKKYLTPGKQPVQLVGKGGGDVDLKFVGADGKTVSTNDLPFIVEAKDLTLAESDTGSITGVYRLDSNRSIEKILHFTGKDYVVGVEFRLNGLQNAISGYHYTAALDNPLPSTEVRSADELANSKAFVGVAGDYEELSVSKLGQIEHKPINGDISYAGARTQYFMHALIPTSEKANAAELSGKGVPAHDGEVAAQYEIAMNVPIKHLQTEALTFNYYLGPLEYDRVSALGVGLEHSMNFGWSFLVRPISIHLMMPLFLWLHSFISNWGLVIIIFSILIKLITMPLSTGQMRSMRKMQVLQPKVTEVREKYKDDAKKMNEELLKLYRTYGVNPAGGCLPMVLQMPILFALYSVLRNVIELRQAPFGLWIHDLSVPDSLFHFGAKIPLIGEQLSGLTLLLVITMFIQQYFTVTDPRQKQMAYIMPFIFIFMFNNLPSGVALYYFMFNIFGLLQQLYLTKIAKPLTLDEMKVDPKKAGGGIMARLQDMEKNQRESRKEQYAGKSLPKGKGPKKG